MGNKNAKMCATFVASPTSRRGLIVAGEPLRFEVRSQSLKLFTSEWKKAGPGEGLSHKDWRTPGRSLESAWQGPHPLLYL